MKIYSYRLINLLYSPYLPWILGLILFILLRSFDSPSLCNGESLSELKENLSLEFSKYKDIHFDHLSWKADYEEALYKPKREYNFYQYGILNNKNYYQYTSDKTLDCLKEAIDALKNIRKIEDSILILEPNFVSQLPKQPYEGN